ncbi:MAG: lipopolysaccharide heptosyltransferase II [Phycisphaerae bacterium]|jgi:heptosyltransferase-2|nr:lipopolysaccharide heptosyltransferase II [Phycisphaerae bacterium]
MSDSCPRSIVVFLPNWVGDVVMATPTLRALRNCFADSHITYFGRSVALDTLGGTDWADDVIEAAVKIRSRTLGQLQLVGALRAGRFDLAVLLTNSFRTAFLAKLAGIGRIAGYDRDARRFLLTDRISPPRDDSGKLVPISAVDYYAELAGLIGVEVSDREMYLPLTDTHEQIAEELFEQAGIDQDRPVVMLNPGASGGTSKIWGPDQFARTADMLIESRGAQIVINAAPPEKPVAADVARRMEGTPAINFADRDNTLGLLKSMLKRTDVLVTNDTGARHIAVAVGSAVVTVFGSTDPLWARINCPRERIVSVEVDCGPCGRKLCNQIPGPIYHHCMGKVTPEMVVEATGQLLDELLAKSEGGPGR